jgi:hypothetical protein
MWVGMVVVTYTRYVYVYVQYSKQGVVRCVYYLMGSSITCCTEISKYALTRPIIHTLKNYIAAICLWNEIAVLPFGTASSLSNHPGCAWSTWVSFAHKIDPNGHGARQNLAFPHTQTVREFAPPSTLRSCAGSPSPHSPPQPTIVFDTYISVVVECCWAAS